MSGKQTMKKSIGNALRIVVAAALISSLTLSPILAQSMDGGRRDRFYKERQEYNNAPRDTICNKIDNAVNNNPGYIQILEELSVKGFEKTASKSLYNIPISDTAEAAGRAVEGDYSGAGKTAIKAICTVGAGMLAKGAAGYILATIPALAIGIGVGYVVKNYLDNYMPSNALPTLPQQVLMPGRWFGKLTMHTLVVDAGGGQQGCDLTGKVNGQSTQLTLDLQGSSESGVAVFTAKAMPGYGQKGGDSVANLNYRCSNGVFKASGPMRDGTVTLDGKLTAQPSGNRWLGGNWSWNGLVGENRARASGSWGVSPLVKQ
jgi:hypothetical protein